MEHDGDVRCVAMAIDGRYAVSGSEDGTARVWEVPSGKLLARLEHGGPVSAVLLANDGNYLATRGETKAGKVAVRLWKAPGGKLITQIPQADGAIAFSPDSKRFAVATSVANSGDLLIYDPATGKKTFSISGNAPHALAFTADSRRLTNGERVWDAVTGQEVSRFQFQPDENDQVRAVAFSQDDKFVVTGTGGQFAFIVGRSDRPAAEDLQAEETKKLCRAGRRVSARFQHDGFVQPRREVSGDGGRRYPGACLGGGRTERGGNAAAPEHCEMGRFYWERSAGVNCRRRWNRPSLGALSGHELTRITHDEEAEQYSEASSNSSGKYIVVGAGRRVSLWESATGRVSRRLVHKTAVADVTFSHDGKLLATCDTTTARVWDVASSALIAPPMIQQEANIGSSLRDKLKSVDFSADGKLLATANGDQTARIWDVTSGNEIVRLPLKGMVDMASFGADGKVFVTTNSGNGPEEKLDLWDGPDWHLAFHEEAKSALLSPDGKLLAIANENKLRILGVTNRKQMLSIDLQDQLFPCAFSLDSKYIAMVDDKGTVSIIEIASGQRKPP